MRNTAIFLLGASLLVSGGCYHYVPAVMDAVPPGADVRALLSGDGIEAMRGTFGPDVTSVKGPLVSWNEGGMGLLAELFVQREGFPGTTMTETIQLLPHHVARVELRELDGLRTAGFSAALVGAAAVALIAPGLIGGSTEDSGEGGGPDPEAAILFRIPIGFGFR